MRQRLLLIFPFFALALCMCLACLSLATTKKPPAKPVNLNTASATELQTVPGIGPATAEKIVQMRKSYGAFKSVDDLLAIRGIGPKRLDKMRKHLTVGKPGAVGPAAPNTKCPSCDKKKTQLADADSPQEKR
jgi:competence ComEA-like helix-hairpin-helix protein